MDRFGPTAQVSKKLVHLLRWSSFPGRTGRKFWLNGSRPVGPLPARICPQLGELYSTTALELFYAKDGSTQKQLIVGNDTTLKSGKIGHFANAIVRSIMASFGAENKTAKRS